MTPKIFPLKVTNFVFLPGLSARRARSNSFNPMSRSLSTEGSRGRGFRVAGGLGFFAGTFSHRFALTFGEGRRRGVRELPRGSGATLGALNRDYASVKFKSPVSFSALAVSSSTLIFEEW